MICIASPVRRSGTTLLQRLICSSSNAIIYGETCANDFNLLFNIYSNKKMMATHSGSWHNEQLQNVLTGEVNDWIPDLMPNSDAYLESFRHLINAQIQFYKNFSTKNNRPIWGVKLPEWNSQALSLIQNTHHETKIIYLNRNIKDCVCSAEKMDMIRGQNEIDRFIQIYNQNLDYAKTNLVGENVLHLDYEALVENPAASLTLIAEFTGALNIDPDVMNHKIGNYKENA